MSAAVVDCNGDDITVPEHIRQIPHATQQASTFTTGTHSHGCDDLVLGVEHATLLVRELNDP
jgi:hypothetical protein